LRRLKISNVWSGDPFRRFDFPEGTTPRSQALRQHVISSLSELKQRYHAGADRLGRRTHDGRWRLKSISDMKKLPHLKGNRVCSTKIVL
jgi:hypothetical protein